MIVANVHRRTFYQLIRIALDTLGVRPLAAELGVFKGDNAQDILDALDPKQMFLLDTWSADDFTNAYSPFDTIPAWMDPPSAQYAYYEGDASTPEHWESVHRQVCERFSADQRVTVHRAPAAGLLEFLTRELRQDKADFVYIDASHQYEYVFRDLMWYSQTVGNEGIIQMNDCCLSGPGIRQNLGVLEATARFIKMSDWLPVLLNTTDFSDLILARRNSKMFVALTEIALRAKFDCIEIPHYLLGNARLVRQPGSNKTVLSFA